MADLTAEEILAAIAPAFAADPRSATFLKMAEKRTSAAEECGWNDAEVRNEAVAYRAAHEMQLSARNHGVAGAITNMSEGQQSIGFGSAGTSEIYADLAQTHFGLHLIGMIEGQILPMGVTD